ncbi:MAG TPA: acyl-ACP--UDP-N-acetylglucosamine O-acyltransferase [bacterium]
MKAKIHPTVVIGSHAVIEDNVRIGAGTVIGDFVVVKKGTTIGKHNRIHTGACLGTDPQDYHFRGETSYCSIGDDNIIREYATISRATGRGRKTVIGDRNFIMTYVHIAHNALIGNDTVIASGTQIGGHVKIGDRATLGGLVGVHQKCRIGAYAMVGAKSYINKDVPPYFLARGNRAKVYGVNTKGLRRHHLSWKVIEEIKCIFRHLYCTSENLRRSLALIGQEHRSVYAAEIVRFVRSSRRGIAARA